MSDTSETPCTTTTVGGWERIVAERRRQIARLGYDEAHDDAHETADNLAAAAACYAQAGGIADPDRPAHWPWAAEKWKPKDRLHNLVCAGALYLAAIGWLQRNAAGRDLIGGRRLALERMLFQCAGAIDETLRAHLRMVNEAQEQAHG